MEADNTHQSGAPGEFLTTAYRCRCGHEWVPKGLRYIERPPDVSALQIGQVGRAPPPPSGRGLAGT